MGRNTGLGSLMLVMVVALPFTAAAELPDALFGTWELNVEESVQSSSRFKRTTCEIEPRGDGLRVSYDLVGERGGLIHIEWIGRFDGRDYPVQGVDYVLTHAYTEVDADSYDVVIKVDGQIVATARTTLSLDGQVLTTLTRERNPTGEAIETKVIYERQ